MDVMINRCMTSDVSSPVRHLTTIFPAVALAGDLDTTRIYRVTSLTGDCTALTVANLAWAPP
jgi:hypothetical protein